MPGGGVVGGAHVAKPRNVREAAPILELAWDVQMSGAPLHERVRQGLLAVSGFEGRWGNASYTLPDGSKVGNANNWGSIHCTRDTPKAGELWSHCVSATDTNEKGERFTQGFRGYDDPISGARDFIRLLKSHGTLAVMQKTGDAGAIARHMKKTYRYAAPVANYAKAIQSMANQNAAQLQVPNQIRTVSGATGSAKSSLIPIGLTLGGLLLAGLFRRRKRR